MHNNNTTDQTETTNLMTPVKGLLVLLGIIIVVAGFIALNTALGIHEFWAGFLFLLYCGNRAFRLGQTGRLCGGRHCGITDGVLSVRSAPLVR